MKPHPLCVLDVYTGVGKSRFIVVHVDTKLFKRHQECLLVCMDALSQFLVGLRIRTYIPTCLSFSEKALLSPGAHSPEEAVCVSFSPTHRPQAKPSFRKKQRDLKEAASETARIGAGRMVC